MEALLRDIVDEVKRAGMLSSEYLRTAIFRANEGRKDNKDHLSKKQILPYILELKKHQPDVWESFGLNPEQEEALLKVLRVKPMRTASGVATITVITRPWPCSSDCIYCPNDLRMPKSYLSTEPACQRAEQNFFDPYLQVVSRLRQLELMGHPTDKIELIVLGGTWCDYPQSFQIWYITQLFTALNHSPQERDAAFETRKATYEEQGFCADPQLLAQQAAALQEQVNQGLINYNRGAAKLYGTQSVWHSLMSQQQATFDELKVQHELNESAANRAVGLVVETRPDTISAQALTTLRRLGCTKIQMVIQSVNQEVLLDNRRSISPQKSPKAMALVRLFGFKLHTHFMVNLLGATPQSDKADYFDFVTNPAYLPDEVKLYPCALVEGAQLCKAYEAGEWRPYTEEELMDVLVDDVCVTQPYTRISRMIRDIGSQDILVGNKKTNLRQMVENRLAQQGKAPQVQEIRFREISTNDVSVNDLHLDVVPYITAVSQEYFLQWVTDDNHIAGFLRLSLPTAQALEQYGGLPINPGEAMIRELHVYGRVAQISTTGDSAQHHGLGKRLIQEAVKLAKDAGYTRLNVISSIGTRGYYRSCGFEDGELYQSLPL